MCSAPAVFWQSKILCNYLFRVNLTGVKLDCVKKASRWCGRSSVVPIVFLKVTQKLVKRHTKAFLQDSFSPKTFKEVSDDSSETQKVIHYSTTIFLTFLKLELSAKCRSMKYCYLSYKFRFCFSAADFSYIKGKVSWTEIWLILIIWSFGSALKGNLLRQYLCPPPFP